MLFLYCQLGEQAYAIPYHVIDTIVPWVILETVPQAPIFFAGFFNYHDKLIPVIDLRQLIHGQNCTMRLNSRIILVKIGQQQLGLLAEQIIETQHVAEHRLKHNTKFTETPWFDGFIMNETNMIQCLALPALIEQKILPQINLLAWNQNE